MTRHELVGLGAITAVGLVNVCNGLWVTLAVHAVQSCDVDVQGRCRYSALELLGTNYHTNMSAKPLGGMQRNAAHVSEMTNVEMMNLKACRARGKNCPFIVAKLWNDMPSVL